MSQFPILTFHSVDDSGSVISIAPDDLATVMQGLANAGWRGCSLSDALAAWKRDGDDAGRRFAITFDDGYRNVLDEALPVFRDLEFGATVFVITGRCGSDNRWEGQAGWVPEMPLLDWPDLERLVAAGWEIGSHGRDHMPFTALYRDRVGQEMRLAREELEERLGVSVPVLAYPYGAHDATIRALARECHRAAVGVRLARASRADLQDPFELPRIDAYYLRRLSGTGALEGRAGAAYLALRRWGRAVRRLIADGLSSTSYGYGFAERD